MTNVWTIEDALEGRCILEDVGDERPIEIPPAPPKPPAPVEPMTKDQRHAKLQSLTDKLILMAEANPAAFLDSQSSLNKLLELASRAEDKQEAKAELSPFARLEAAPNLRLPPTATLWAALLQTVGEKYIRPEMLHEFNSMMIDNMLAVKQ